jgi:hypothetical protein
MTRLLRSLLEKADAIAPRKFLWINLGLAALIGLAHGGALLAVRAKPTPDAAAIESLATISLPLAGLVALFSVVALLLRRLQPVSLALQGLILAASAVAGLVWGLGILLRGTHEGNFSWSPGLFSASVCYGVFMLSRFGVPALARASAVAYFAPAVAVVLAVPIDIGVFIRLIQTIAGQFGG